MFVEHRLTTIAAAKKDRYGTPVEMMKPESDSHHSSAEGKQFEQSAVADQ
jgi:hypothetical protein